MSGPDRWTTRPPPRRRAGARPVLSRLRQSQVPLADRDRLTAMPPAVQTRRSPGRDQQRVRHRYVRRARRRAQTKACHRWAGRMEAMKYNIDVPAEVRKIASSKPVRAAAGASVLATETLRELPGRIV